MADKAISELVAASAVSSTDLFVLEQGGTAKKLTGQTLENWLVHMADGHGGIQTIEKTSTSGLVDTYTITFADTTTSTFTVKNGKAIQSIATYYAVSSNGTTPPTSWSLTRQNMTPTNRYLWSYQSFTYNDGSRSASASTVIGIYGDTGAQTYVWIKYAAVMPTSDSDVGDDPDKWIGIYVGLSDTAPTSYTEYTWYEYKGEKGDQGDASTIVSQSVTYLEGSSGTVIPSGSWTTTIPSVTPGNYLWTRTRITFNDDTEITAYSVSRFGIDGTGSVSTVNGQSPDINGNVALTAGNIPTSDNQSVQAHLDARRTAAAQDAIDEAQDAAIAGIILESTGDTTDRTAEILSRLTTYKKCILGTGTFYTTGIDMPNESSLIGCGDATILLKTGNGDYVVKMNQYNTVSNLHINGNDNDMSATPGTHHGVLWLGDFSTTETHTLPREGKISNLSIENCNGGGITCNDTGTGRIYNLVACNIAIMSCSVGIYIPFLSEYHRFTNVDAWYCYYGCINNGGNNCFVNCDFSDSRVVGFVIDNSNGDKTNNSHGTCVGCSFNHIANNTGLALSLNGVTAGFTFGNCNIFRGSVEIINCIGVTITDTLFGKSATITITNSTAIQFANDTFQENPTVTVTGSSYPHFRDCFNYTTGASILNSELTPRTVSTPYTVAANGTYNANLYTLINNDMPSGYECVGITGVQSGNKACVAYSFRYLNNGYSLGIRNIGSTAVSSATATIEYLCKPI